MKKDNLTEEIELLLKTQGTKVDKLSTTLRQSDDPAKSKEQEDSTQKPQRLCVGFAGNRKSAVVNLVLKYLNMLQNNIKKVYTNIKSKLNGEIPSTNETTKLKSQNNKKEISEEDQIKSYFKIILCYFIKVIIAPYAFFWFTLDNRIQISRVKKDTLFTSLLLTGVLIIITVLSEILSEKYRLWLISPYILVLVILTYKLNKK